MSEQQLIAFLEQVKVDAGLQQKLNGADLGSVEALAQASGLVIHADDLEYTKPVLSEMELESVSGGAFSRPLETKSSACLMCPTVVFC